MISKGITSRVMRKATSLGVSLLFFFFEMVSPVFALPSGAKVESGNATFEQVGDTTLNITSSDKAIISYDTFNVGANETINFYFFVPSGDASVLNRVTGGTASEIFGNINSIGRVFIENQAGILFGSTASVNVGALIASTLHLSNENFLSSNYSFTQELDGNPSAIINHGSLSATENGGIVLVAGAVENTGTIEATRGSVVLAGGAEQATLKFGENSLISVTVDKAVADDVLGADGEKIKDAIRNKGKVEADGGKVSLTANQVNNIFDKLVNQEGIIEAQTVRVNGDGTVDLLPGTIEIIAPHGVISNTGSIRAEGVEGAGNGGKITVRGNKIYHEGLGLVSANAHNNGTAGDIEIISEESTDIQASSEVTARGYEVDSAGGNIVINTLKDGSLNGTTNFEGAVDVSGGTVSGDGGFIEVSGKNLNYNGQVRGTAQEGYTGGRLLIDPLNLLFNNTGQPAPTNNPNGTPDVAAGDAPAGGTTVIQISDVRGFSEARFEATQDITIDNNFTMNSNRDLVLRAGRNINVNANVRVRGNGGDLTLEADAAFAGLGLPSDGIGTVNQAAGTQIRADNGTLNIITSEDFVVGNIRGGNNGTINITSRSGNILDDGIATTRIRGGTLNLIANAAGKGVGTTAAPVQTDIARLSVDVGTGDATVLDRVSFRLDSATVATNGSLDLRANSELQVQSNANINTTGTGEIKLTADADNNGGGRIRMFSNSTLSTESGNITIRGGNSTNELRNVTSTSGNIDVSTRQHVRTFNAVQTGGSGTVSFTADNDGNNSGSVLMNNGSSITTNTGNITLSGAGNSDFREVKSSGGNIQGTSVANVRTFGEISTTGSSTVTIRADSDNNGSGTLAMQTGSTLKSGTGKMELRSGGTMTLRGVTSTGGDIDASSRGTVTVFNNVTTAGNGKIDVTADSDANNSGTINMQSGSSLNSANGNITLKAGNGTSNIRGINSTGGDIDIRSQQTVRTFNNITTTGNGTVSLIGDSNSSGSGAVSMQNGSSVNTQAGDITITGSGNSTTRLLNSTGGNISASTTGNLSVNGANATGGNGTLTLTADSENNGTGALIMQNGSSATTVNGDISLNSGSSATIRTLNSTSGNISANSRGNVRFFNNVTTGGSGTINVTADKEGSGAGTFQQNAGTSLTTGGGNISISGADDMTLRTLNAGSGEITVNAIGNGTDIRDDNNNITKLTANRVTLTAGGLVGNAGNAQMDLSTNEVVATAGNGNIGLSNDKALLASQVTASGSNRDVFLTTTSGDLMLGNISATDDLTITSAGSVLAQNAASTITGNRLVLNASTNIGAGALPLRLNLTSNTSNLNAVSGNAHVQFETGSLTVNSQNIAGGVSTFNTSRGTLAVSAANGDVTLKTQAGDITTTGDLTFQNGDLHLNASNNATISVINSGAAVNVIAGNNILDGNGAANNITAAANSTLNAGGLLGTAADPIEVNINGALNVTAGAAVGGISGAINGIVTPSNTLSIFGTPPGDILFNGAIVEAPAVVTPVALGANLLLSREIVFTPFLESISQSLLNRRYRSFD